MYTFSFYETENLKGPYIPGFYPICWTGYPNATLILFFYYPNFLNYKFVKILDITYNSGISKLIYPHNTGRNLSNYDTK
jgi:hypothetical protein